MTLKEYDALKVGQKIKILHPLERGRIVGRFIKFTSQGNKGVMVGNVFYKLKDIELLK